MIGTLLQGRYRLDQEIAHGGMGVVYRGYDILLDRPVAIKVLSASGLGEEVRTRLLHEAQSIARLNHPNIVTVYDAGEMDGLAFIVMELVEGESLHSRQPQSTQEILSIARQICAALEHAHDHGIIHRDLKPENVIITPDGIAKLMDFGLARSNASRLTVEGSLVGTVFYLAPEQALGQEVDGRADLYALGVMLYELFTGRLPFTGDDPLAVVSQHIHSNAVPPSQFRPDLPTSLEAVILKLLAKSPDDRFINARQAALSLSEAAPAGALPSPANIPNNLPIQFSSFIGRANEIEEVSHLLSTSRLVTLTGAGGSGKTRLALQVASNLLETFPGGVWLVELAPLSDPALVPQAVASTLGLREQPGRQIVDTLVDYLRSRQMLLVLDNCEHLIQACAQLAEHLLRNSPSLKILATSREAIGITGERAWLVPSMSVPDPQSLNHLPGVSPLSGNGSDDRGEALVNALKDYESVQLFLDRAAAVQPAFTLNERNAQFVAQICQRLDGVPLAIELAAARMKALSVEQIAARLDDRFNLLTMGSRTAMPRHQTLRATIDWSHDLLSDAERSLFYRLSVFAGGWTLESAEAVCTCQTIAKHQVLDLLTHLLDKSLVLVEEQDEWTRYRMLETIRQYALEKLQQAEDWDEVHRRHLEFFLGLSIQAEPELRSAGQIDWLERLEVEHDNLRAALDWSLAHGEPLAGLRIAGNLSRFWYLHGYWREGRDWLERTLQANRDPVEPDDLRARARALYGLGWMADESGKEEMFYSESLELCRQVGDKWGQAFALRGLGVLAANQDDETLAEERLEQSLALFRELDDAWGIALVQFNLGWIAMDRDDNMQAASLWQESLSNFQRSGDRWGRAVTLGAMSYMARLKNDYSQATARSKESLALFRELGDKAGIADSLSRLGNVAYRRDDIRQAMALFEESLVLNRELGYRINVAYAYSILGLLAGYQGDFRRAHTLLEESQAAFQETDYRWGNAWIQDVFGQVAYYQGHIEQAAKFWKESLEIYRQEKDKNGIASVLNGLGLIAVHQGDLDKAAQLLQESLAAARESGDKRTAAIVLTSQGRLSLATGDFAAAAGFLNEGLALRRYLGAKRGIAESLEGLTQLALAQGEVDRAARFFGAAQVLREAIGAPLPPVERSSLERQIAETRSASREEFFAFAWEQGRSMTETSWEQIIAYAID